MPNAKLTSQQIAELRKVARGESIPVSHWVFAPLCWAMLHERGFLKVTFRDDRLSAQITKAGRAIIDA